MPVVQILYRNLDNKKYNMPLAAYTSHQQGSISFFCFDFFSKVILKFPPSPGEDLAKPSTGSWYGESEEAQRQLNLFEIYSMFPKRHKTNYTR